MLHVAAFSTSALTRACAIDLLVNLRTFYGLRCRRGRRVEPLNQAVKCKQVQDDAGEDRQECERNHLVGGNRLLSHRPTLIAHHLTPHIKGAVVGLYRLNAGKVLARFHDERPPRRRFKLHDRKHGDEQHHDHGEREPQGRTRPL
jgi:hypothetical protein